MCKILLTKEERKALVVLHSDASHGPWAYESDGDNGNFNVGIVLGDDDKPIFGYVEDNTCIVVDVIAREVEGSPNAAFIVGAYNAFPRLLYGLEVLEARAEQAEDSLRESISKQDEMAAGIEKLAAANKGLAEKAQLAEAEVERLRGVVLAQEDFMQSTVNAIFKADITEDQRQNIINDKQRISKAVTCILARNAGSSQLHVNGTPCPICGQSGHIGDCEED